MQTWEGLVGVVYKILRAKGRSNSQQTVLGVVASLLIVVYKRMQRLPIMLAHHRCWSVTRSYYFAVSKETMCNAPSW